MKRALMLLALCVTPASALAQTTTCGWQGSQWVCNTQPGVNWSQPAPQPFVVPDYVGDGIRIRAQAQEARARDQALREQQEDAFQAEAARTRSQETGKLVADGKCDDALRYALTAGDFDLAAKVRSACPALVGPK